MTFQPSELIINDRGGVYHLGIRPEELAPTVILVGDPDRVQLVSSFFDQIECNHQHREFVTCTGYYSTKRITVVSTGIGTDNIDIVLNELDALANIDLTKREVKPTLTSLNIVRIGTCGILNSSIPIDSYILSTHALGLDNVPYYYLQTLAEDQKAFITELKQKVSFPEGVLPYLVPSSSRLNHQLTSSLTHEGVTVTGCGFYAPQGRRLRIPLAQQDFIEELSTFNFNNLSFANFEMECSAVFALSQIFGHEATAICLGIANRKTQEFSSQLDNRMKELIQYTLDRL